MIQLRSWSQGHGIESRIRLCTQHGACLFLSSAPFPVCSLSFSLSFFLSQLTNQIKCLKKKNRWEGTHYHELLIEYLLCFEFCSIPDILYNFNVPFSKFFKTSILYLRKWKPREIIKYTELVRDTYPITTHVTFFNFILQSIACSTTLCCLTSFQNVAKFRSSRKNRNGSWNGGKAFMGQLLLLQVFYLVFSI